MPFLDVNIIPSVRSHHSRIRMHKKSLTEQNKGQNYWKCNNSLLQDNQYIIQINDNFESWLISDIVDKCVQWEIIKYNIIKYTIQYSIKKTKSTSAIDKNKDIKGITNEEEINFIQYTDDTTAFSRREVSLGIGITVK